MNVETSSLFKILTRRVFNFLNFSILSQFLTVKLNINSLQNKFEELKPLNSLLKAHVLVISETKIDESYSSGRFSLPGYHIYRKDRKKAPAD